MFPVMLRITSGLSFDATGARPPLPSRPVYLPPRGVRQGLRSVIQWVALWGAVAMAGAAESPVKVGADPTGVAVERAHREIWRRFIDPHGVLYDYTSLGGQVILPTPEECELGKPNALGWWTPIENGPFFGGLYLDALCNRWRLSQQAEAAHEAKRVAAGLIRLAGVGGVPGFVARGFATDGKAHYTASSSDQTYPWFYGLWRYANSGLADAGERRQVVETMERIATAIEKNGWRMPGDKPGFGDFGHWSSGYVGDKGTLVGAEPQFDAATRYLFVLRALAQLTGRTRWAEAYQMALNGIPHGSEKTRRTICRGGVSYVAPGEPPRYPESPNLWTSTSSQAALRALWEMESDPLVRADFQTGLDANAASAARFVAGFKRYDNDNALVFDIRWRALTESWQPQPLIAEAVKLGTLQYRAWKKISPRKVAESEQMRDPLFAAWIVALSGNASIIRSVNGDIDGALRHFRWETLYTSFFFMAECVHWQLQRDAMGSGSHATVR